jgi:hypothetical protein
VTAKRNSKGISSSSSKNSRSELAGEYIAVKEREVMCLVPGCGYKPTKSSDLRKHRDAIHKTASFICSSDGCGFTCNARNALTSHYKNGHGIVSISCNVPGCGFLTASATDLRNHVDTVHKSASLKCSSEDCGFTCHSQLVLLSHEKCQHGIGGTLRVPAPALDEANTVPGGSLQPSKEYPSEAKVEAVSQCICLMCNSQDCEFTYTWKSFEEKKYDIIPTCPFRGCGVQCVHAFNIRNHVASVHASAAFKCTSDGCGFTCHRRNSLTFHYRYQHGISYAGAVLLRSESKDNLRVHHAAAENKETEKSKKSEYLMKYRL